jgi:hypothetical protein
LVYILLYFEPFHSRDGLAQCEHEEIRNEQHQLKRKIEKKATRFNLLDSREEY